MSADDVLKRFLEIQAGFEAEAKKAGSPPPELEAQMARVKGGLPSVDTCPDCFLVRGVDSRFVPGPPDKDGDSHRLVCPECGWDHDDRDEHDHDGERWC